MGCCYLKKKFDLKCSCNEGIENLCFCRNEDAVEQYLTRVQIKMISKKAESAKFEKDQIKRIERLNELF